MEQPGKFNLRLKIASFIDDINYDKVMNKTDQDELSDHFYSEIEGLKKAGLNDREAFEVCRLRFGDVDLIEQEYQKARPRKSLLGKLFIGATFFFGFQFVTSLFRIINSSILVFIYKNYELNIDAIILYPSIAIASMSIVAPLAYYIFKKFRHKTSLLWTIPILSSVVFVGERMLIPLYSFLLSGRFLGDIMLNQSYTYTGAWVLLTGVFVFLMFKNRDDLEHSIVK